MSKNKSDKSKPEGSSPSGLPLLYSKPSPLDSIRHSQSAIVPLSDYSFAKNTNSLPLNAIEFIEAAKTYPIVFTSGENIMPVAIVGMEKENYFVRPDNSWKEGAYIPAYVRQYPFIFFENPKDEKFYLCIDEVAKNFSPNNKEVGMPLYNEKGEPTEFTSNALRFCTSYYQHHIITKNFCADLKEYKLLQPYNSEITLSSGKKTTLSGFQMIDENALNALPNKAYLVLRDKGWIPFIYLSLAAASNWKNLIVAESK